MGTSSRYEGKKRSRLVPDSFDDIKIDDLELQEQNDTLDNEADASLEENNLENDKRDDLNEEIQSTGYAEYPWKAVKSYMSNFASRRKGYNLKQLLSNYVKAYGGSTNAARTSKIAVITTIKIGAFFTSVSNKSIEQVLSENGIQIKHRTAKEILSDVVNFLAPMPDTKENAVARKALISTMSLVYEKLENENTDISVLNLIDQKFTEKLITEYFISFIYENLIHDL
jgi:hypothetical protein